MKIRDWSKNFLCFVLGAGFIGLLSFISKSEAQQNQFVKLMMRFGEERVLEDGTKVGISRGEGDLIIVTLSKPRSSIGKAANANAIGNTQGIDFGAMLAKIPSANSLKIGTYIANALETSDREDFGTTGGPYPANVKIKVKSIESNGNMKAEISIASRKGTLSGKLDAGGKLQLEGTLLSGRTLWEIKLTAVVKDNSLINGKYVSSTNYLKLTGGFKKAIMVEDEE